MIDLDISEKEKNTVEKVKKEEKESKWKFTLWSKSCNGYEIFDPWFAKAPLFSSIDQAKRFLQITDIYTMSDIIVPVDVNNVYKAPRDGFIDCDSSYYYRGHIIKLHTLEKVNHKHFLDSDVDICARILGSGIEFVDVSTINENNRKEEIVIDSIKVPIKGLVKTTSSVDVADQTPFCKYRLVEAAEYMSVIYNQKSLILTLFYDKTEEKKPVVVCIENIKSVIVDKFDKVYS